MKHNIVTAISAIALVLCGFAFWETGYVEIILGLIVIFYLASTTYGSFQIRANYFVKSIHKGNKKSVAFTFDDGPDPEITPRILAVLKEKGVKATFFVIGEKAEKYPDLLRQIDEEGHIVANHSYSHNHLIGFFSKKRLNQDLTHCNEAIIAALGKSPVFFRPPFGVTNPRYANVLKGLKMQSIGWSLRSFDTRAKNKYQLIEKVISNLKRRDIVLLHDNRAVTADALEDLIEHCFNKNIEIQPLSIIINKEPYETV
ncbi:polysaccharide deacetylase family protein [Dyadobacter frigoris]|uniref:Polysaccharide deacetylase family protein n=1 Tax=Dyadobacter frigoris TaxID=2576211 RepID=A0A4U6D9L1_9BACT|nr:polysaccharide deacetylase family protein [Dyadobacter frigoris]TKT90934.1 polysaccharide deacetylase family protein [Dyadobacter frigoris]